MLGSQGRGSSYVFVLVSNQPLRLEVGIVCAGAHEYVQGEEAVASNGHISEKDAPILKCGPVANGD
jgi:hypothetical protein